MDGAHSTHKEPQPSSEPTETVLLARLQQLEEQLLELKSRVDDLTGKVSSLTISIGEINGRVQKLTGHTSLGEGGVRDPKTA